MPVDEIFSSQATLSIPSCPIWRGVAAHYVRVFGLDKPLAKRAVASRRVPDEGFGRGKPAVHPVDDVSFELTRGEITGVVGESGSGKSTLARLLLRLLDPTSGTIALDGRDVTALRGRQLKPYWREVQAVFQDPFSAFNSLLLSTVVAGPLTSAARSCRPAGPDERRPLPGGSTPE